MDILHEPKAQQFQIEIINIAPQQQVHYIDVDIQKTHNLCMI